MPPESVPRYIDARLRTVGLVEASAAVLASRAAGSAAGRLRTVQDELLARTPSQPLRKASGLLGRGLQRLAERLWPDHPAVLELRTLDVAPMRPIALGVAGAAVEMSGEQIARVSLYDDAQTVAAAALKLLPVDPTDSTRGCWKPRTRWRRWSPLRPQSGAWMTCPLSPRRWSSNGRSTTTHVRGGSSLPEHSHVAQQSQRRALRLGVAGPVGTGKSTLIATLCRELSHQLRIAVVTNDIYTDEDARLLRSAGVLPVERIRAIETGACPHTAIRDDVTPNLIAVEDLENDFAPLDLVIVESGGDNLTATFSPALVDAQIFCLDVAGGGDVARKGGPGIERADLLIVNKTDLAPYVGVDPEQMVRDASEVREGLPVLALSQSDPDSVGRLCAWVNTMVADHRQGDHVPRDPGPMAPHSHPHDAEHDHVHG